MKPKLYDAIKSLLAIGIPMASSRFLLTFNTFAVMAMIAQLGHNELAASFTIAMSRIVMLVIFMSPLYSIAAITSRIEMATTSTEKNRAALVGQAWALALLLGLFPLLMLSQLHHVLVLFKQPKHLIPLISDYFHYYRWAIPGIYLLTVNNQYLAGIQRQHDVLLLSVFTFLLTISLNAVLIFGLLGLPKLGITGAGMAGMISVWLAVLLSTTWIVLSQRVNLRLFQPGRFHFAQQIVSVGWPMLIRSASELSLVYVITLMIGWLGVNAMAASQISNEYLLLALLPLIGFGEAGSILVGHSLGKREQQDLHDIQRACLLVVTGFTVIVAVVVLIFHKPLADLFIDFSKPSAPEIYHLAMYLLALRVAKMLFVGPIQIYNGLLRGCFDTFVPMILSLSCNWFIIMPLAYYFGFILEFGVIGIVLSSAVAECVLAIALSRRWRHVVQQQALDV